MEYILELENVSYTNVDYLVLKNINIKIKKNTITAIIGESGAGKSTLLKLLAGIFQPDEGKFKFNNIELNQLYDEEMSQIKKKIGFVFQDAALLSNLNIKENLELPLRFHNKNMSNKEVDNKIMKYLEKVEMLDALNDRPAQLSLGEQKLVGIARALITEPEILLLDEPLSSIDASKSIKMINLAKEYANQENTTLIIVTNLRSIISELCDKMVMIQDKSIILDDFKSNILNMDPKNRPKLINDILIGG